MTAALRLLIVEDTQHEAELTILELRMAGYRVVPRVEQTPEGVVAALEEGEIDFVIVDYEITGFSGMEAAKLVADWDPDVPVVMVSGRMGEEQVVAAMRAGVRAYVDKDQLTRLTPIVARELSEAQKRREGRAAQVALEESERALRSLNEELERRVDERTEALLFSREAAEAANRAKGAFLANMSHELRTPLNAILGFAQLLERSVSLDESEHAHVRAILSSSERLLALVHDVLDMSKAEDGRMTVDLNTCDLREWFSDLEERFLPLARNKGLSLEFDVSTGVPQHVLTDVTKFQQICVNLVENAVTYTVQGGVRVSVESKVSAVDEIRLVLEVEDTGPGLTPDELEIVFEPFGRAKGTVALGGGTGLGIPLSREYAQLLGGDLKARSEPGFGSTFRVELSVTQMAAGSAPTLALNRTVSGLRSQGSTRVLVAVGANETRALAVALLEAAGLDARTALSGPEVIELCESWQPAVIIMDRKLPKSDGYQTACEARESGPGGSAKILLMSHDPLAQEAREALTANGDELLSRPFGRNEFLERIGRLAGVDFAYDEEPGVDVSETVQDGAVLTRAGMVDLPVGFGEKMREAAESADVFRLGELAEELSGTQPELAKRLQELVEQYEYDRLLELF